MRQPQPARILLLAGVLAALAACGGPKRASEDTGAPAPRPVATAPATGAGGADGPGGETSADAPGARPFVLVLLGDTLSDAAGLPADLTLPARLEDELAALGADAEVRDASAADGGAAAGLARFDAAVGADADGVLIELGAEDMLAHASPAAVKATLAQTIERAQARDLWVGLVGLEPPLGSDAAYDASFNALYADLARDYGVDLYPFFYAGLVDRETGEARPELFEPDGLHPTDLGVAIVAEGMADWLADALPEK